MKVFIILFLLVGMASAATFTWQAKDINTRQPINNVSLRIDNVSNVFIRYTDINGLKEETLNKGYHYYTASKAGYLPYANTSIGNLTADQVDNTVFYMTPISEEGIIRVIWTDDTINYPDRKLCVFYKENGRLQGCFYKNETMQLLNNREYIVEPQTNFFDQMTSIDSIWENRFNVIPYLGLVLLGLYIVMSALRKR